MPNLAVWVNEVMQREFTPEQLNVSKAMEVSDFVAVKTSMYAGVTTLICLAALHFALTKTNAVVKITTSNYYLLHGIILPELTKWIARGNLKVSVYPEDIEVRIVNQAHIEGDLKFLYLFDQSQSITDSTFLCLEGRMLKKNTKFVLFGSPTSRTGYFYGCFHENKLNWHLENMATNKNNR